METDVTRGHGVAIPPDELGGIIDDLISIAEQLAESGDDVNAGLINNIVDQLMLYLPD